MPVLLTDHARLRLHQRTRTSESELLGLIAAGRTVKLSGNQERRYELFYDKHLRSCFCCAIAADTNADVVVSVWPTEVYMYKFSKKIHDRVVRKAMRYNS